jgi:alpha-tubulin suppressor-like RCC1 family protein
VLDEEGYAYAAGNSEDGKLGVTHYDFVPKICERPYVLVDVFNKDKKGLKVCAGDGFSVFLTEWGEVFSCGKGNFGRLGHGRVESLNKATKIKWF